MGFSFFYTLRVMLFRQSKGYKYCILLQYIKVNYTNNICTLRLAALGYSMYTYKLYLCAIKNIINDF